MVGGVIVVVVLFMGCAPQQGDARFIGRREETDDWLCGPCLSSLTIPRFWTICALTSGVPALRRSPAGGSMVEVDRPDAPSAEQARNEIEMHLQIWDAIHPGRGAATVRS